MLHNDAAMLIGVTSDVMHADVDPRSGFDRHCIALACSVVVLPLHCLDKHRQLHSTSVQLQLFGICKAAWTEAGNSCA